MLIYLKEADLIDTCDDRIETLETILSFRT